MGRQYGAFEEVARELHPRQHFASTAPARAYTMYPELSAPSSTAIEEQLLRFSCFPTTIGH